MCFTRISGKRRGSATLWIRAACSMWRLPNDPERQHSRSGQLGILGCGELCWAAPSVQGWPLLPIGWIRGFEPQTKWWLIWEHGFWPRFPRGTRRGGAALPKLGHGLRRLSTSVRNAKVYWRTYVNKFCGTTSPDACTRGISTRPSASHGSSVGSRSVSRRTGAQFSSASISSRLAASGAAGGLLRSGGWGRYRNLLERCTHSGSTGFRNCLHRRREPAHFLNRHG